MQTSTPGTLGAFDHYSPVVTSVSQDEFDADVRSRVEEAYSRCFRAKPRKHSRPIWEAEAKPM
jgi:hypothetical protein